MVTDLHGVTGRDIMEHLIAGERNPKVLAQLDRARARRKITELEHAVEGAGGTAARRPAAARSGQPHPRAGVGAEVTALAFDGTGWRLAAGDEDGKVHVWDLAELADAAPVNAIPGAAAFGAVPLETAEVGPPGTLPDASRPHSGRVLALAWDDARDRWLSASTAGPHGWPAVPRRRARGSRVFRSGRPRSAPMAASRR